MAERRPPDDQERSDPVRKALDADQTDFSLTTSAEWLRVTLASIGDGVITTDQRGRVTFLNAVAESLTGWTLKQAEGRSLTEVFRIVNQETRAEVSNPALRALAEGVIVGLANHTILIARDGGERNIDDSAAPIRNDRDEVAGSVLVFRDITERYRQERLVVEGRAYAEDILSTLRHPFLVLDKDLRVVSANRAFYKFFKVEPSETEGRLVYELGDRQWDIVKLRELLERIVPVDGHPVEDFEVVHDFSPPPLGIGRKVMSLNARRVNRPGNRSQLILLDIEDITERQAARELLRASETRYRRLFEAAHDGILIVDRGTLRITEVNAFLIELLDFPREHFIGKELWEIGLLGDKEASRQAMRELEEKGSIRYDDLPLRDRQGRRRPVEMVANVYIEDRRPVIQCNIRDISARKAAEAALHESEARRRMALDAAELGTWHVDVESGRLTTDGRFRAIFGSGGDPLDFESAMLIIHPQDRGRVRDAVAAAMRRDNPAPYAIEYRVVHPNGAVRWVFAKGRSSFDDAGEDERSGPRRGSFDGTVADISSRIAAEHQIKEQAERLAGESRRKDEFLAMLSHELRNPLAPIRSAVHLLKLQDRGSENALQRQAREIIERQSGNLSKIVSDLLEVSRVVSGRIRLELAPVDLNQLIRHAAESAGPLIEQRGHTLVLHTCDEGTWVNVDAARIEQVLVNLLNNAAKYTPEGGRIEVYCERRVVRGPRGDEECASLRVRDNGEGLDADLLPRLFDLFTQADRSLARSAGGLGIGLALSHRLVDLHGGMIEAKSEGVGLGSEFTVTLPLMHVAPEPASVEAAPVHDENPRGVRVLIVDDNLDQAMMLAAVLRQDGYGVQTAYTGPDGLKVALVWRPHIVLLDIGLPGMDGYEVARRLRADPVLAGDSVRMRLIALTGYGREEDKDRAREAGFDFHLVKPVDFDALERVLAENKPQL